MILESREKYLGGIEGIPFIIRFKTKSKLFYKLMLLACIEGIPFIIRFKTVWVFRN